MNKEQIIKDITEQEDKINIDDFEKWVDADESRKLIYLMYQIVDDAFTLQRRYLKLLVEYLLEMKSNKVE